MLHQSPHDLLRALRAGDKGQHLRVGFLSVAYPAGTRAREHRETALRILLFSGRCKGAFSELGSVLAEGEVPRECGVKDSGKAEGAGAECAEAAEDLFWGGCGGRGREGEGCAGGCCEGCESLWGYGDDGDLVRNGIW